MAGEQVLFFVLTGWAIIATMGWIVYAISVRSDIDRSHERAIEANQRAHNYGDKIAEHKRQEDYWREEYGKLRTVINKAHDVLGGK